MSNEIIFRSMKEYLKKTWKVPLLEFSISSYSWGSLLLYGMAIEIARPSEESARGSRTSLCIL